MARWFLLQAAGELGLLLGDGTVAGHGGSRALRLFTGAVSVLEAHADLLGDVGVPFMLLGRRFVGLGGALRRFGRTLGGSLYTPPDFIGHGAPLPGSAPVP